MQYFTQFAQILAAGIDRRVRSCAPHCGVPSLNSILVRLHQLHNGFSIAHIFIKVALTTHPINLIPVMLQPNILISMASRPEDNEQDL